MFGLQVFPRLFPRQFNVAPRGCSYDLARRPCDLGARFGRATRAADAFATISPKRSLLLELFVAAFIDGHCCLTDQGTGMANVAIDGACRRGGKACRGPTIRSRF